MPRTCTICGHLERPKIEAALIAGEPYRDIARHFSLSKDALGRHRDHIPAALARAHTAEEASRADNLLAKVRVLEADARRIGKLAEETADLRTALAGVRELTRLVELMARLRGELQESATVNVTVAPEWLDLRSRILTALEPFPDARRAVVETLGG